MFSLPFHPLVNTWFTETYRKPTPVQEEAWPLISRGEHVLALAPTGSGKTLTGFLAAISRFADGTYPSDRLSVLYVSPLKALNEDIRRNLILPLEGIQTQFEKAGEFFPIIRAETRSGDTPQSERRRFLSRPPSILALTPESLGIILLNPRGRQILSDVRYVILDEIHAALASKRGCFLSCQIDRLGLIAGEFQRIALSATVNPPEAAADFAAGLRKIKGVYEKRKIHIVSPEGKKELRFQVLFPDKDSRETADNPAETDYSGVNRYGKRYTELIKFIIERIKNAHGETILVFTDSRRRAERINYLLNRTAETDSGFMGQPLSYCHHGSLAKEVRRAVEAALAAGEISCVVATGSLELGIDIGSVKEVILAGSPGSSTVALQRIGRSGHGVGMTSTGWLIPFHGMDLLQAAALSGAVEEKELEKTASIENPLDLLAQIILAFTTEKDWNEDELYETLCGFYSYKGLSRVSYDGVVHMLAGAYEETRLRELKRRIFRDEETGMLSAAPGALLLLYTSGGVITSRGLYSLRLAPNVGAGERTKIGELDEEFVWERRLGDCFDFGNSSWRITAIGDEAVEVIPLSEGADSVPFWHGDAVYRGSVLTRRLLGILDEYSQNRKESNKANVVFQGFCPEAGEALENFLHAQSSSQGTIPLPGPSFIPIEIIDDQAGRGDAFIIVFHSFRGGAINFPLYLALAQDMETKYGIRIQGAADDNAVSIRLPRSIAMDPASMVMDSIHSLCEEGTLNESALSTSPKGEVSRAGRSFKRKGEERFQDRLESSGVFGAAFREAAERSLLLPRSPFGKRTPLWVTRQKSKRLFDAVSSYRDFPASAEAWRTCLKENFDMEGFNSLLEDISQGTISLDFFRTREPSPFSKELSWAETNVLMYEYDERPDLLGPPSLNSVGPSLSDRVIAEALGNNLVRPPLKAETVSDFCSRLRRELPGWAPEDSLTLSEWVKERIAIPANGIDDEWEKLLECIPPELRETLREDKSLGGKLEYIKAGEYGEQNPSLLIAVHREWAKKWHEYNAMEFAENCLSQWLRYEGPVSASRISEVFGFSPEDTDEAIRNLAGQGQLIPDVVVENTATSLVCDRENLELLLRLGRKKQRPEIKTRPSHLLIPFIAQRQGLLRAIENSAQKKNEPWESLSGIAAPVKLWETEIFPCRCPSYSAEMLDRDILEGRLLWYGTGKEKAAFCKPRDLDLVLSYVNPPLHPASAIQYFSDKLPKNFFDIPRNFWEIKDTLAANGVSIISAAEALWKEVWKGNLSADSWEPVRRAIENGFTPPESSSGPYPEKESSNLGRRTLRIPRAIRERWRTGPPVKGNWFSLAGDFYDSEDSSNQSFVNFLEEEELNRDRVRILLRRWGILTRPLLEREASILSWSRLLPAIRRMELAGELVTGRFFDGINSLQFASPRIAEELDKAETNHGIYWMNAADPASPAGLDVQSIITAAAKEDFIDSPIRRISSTRLCFRNADLLAVSNKNGKNLEIFISPDSPDIIEALSFIKIPKNRKIQPESKIVVEKINGKIAAGSNYSTALAELGFVKDRGKMILW